MALSAQQTLIRQRNRQAAQGKIKLHIRNAIACARKREAQSNTLHKVMRLKSADLANRVQIDAPDVIGALTEFVTHYIEEAPDLMDGFATLLQRAGIAQAASAALALVDDYCSELAAADAELGFYALLDKAYLAHRVVEEMNDRLYVLTQQRLMQADMTVSNLVAHSILGESFANPIDIAVRHSVETLFHSDTLMQNEQLLCFLAERRQSAALPIQPVLYDAQACGIDLNTAPTVATHRGNTSLH